MANTLPNGRNQGSYIKTQSEIDNLYERQVTALESIAKSLAKIAGGDFKVTASTKAAEQPTRSLFDQIFG